MQSSGTCIHDVQAGRRARAWASLPQAQAHLEGSTRRSKILQYCSSWHVNLDRQGVVTSLLLRLLIHNQLAKYVKSFLSSIKSTNQATHPPRHFPTGDILVNLQATSSRVLTVQDRIHFICSGRTSSCRSRHTLMQCSAFSAGRVTGIPRPILSAAGGCQCLVRDPGTRYPTRQLGVPNIDQ